MSHQYATLEDTVYFYFGSNDTSGSGGDGATPLFDVREAGAAASAIPLLSGTPTLLTHANYPAGCYEVAVAATAANGFAADDVFGVFCTLAIDSQNPTGFVGSCKLSSVPEVTAARMGALTDWIDGGRLDLLLDAIPTTAMRGTDGANTTTPLSAAQVNAEVVDALATDTYAEPGQEVPAATSSLANKINYLFKAWRNKVEQTATVLSIYDDAGTTVDQKATVSDDTTTATKGEIPIEGIEFYQETVMSARA